MKLNLANETDLIFYGFDGNVEHYDNYVVVTTPENPKSYFGNQLISNVSSEKFSLKSCIDLYDRHVKRVSGVSHTTINYQGPEVSDEVKKEASSIGLNFAERLILKVNIEDYLKKDSIGLNICTASSKEDWELLALRSSESTHENKSPSYNYFRDHFNTQNEMQQKGLSNWYLGKVNDTIVSTLGLMISKESSLARYQAVLTNEGERGKGYGSALLWGAANLANQKFGVSDFVIVTDVEHQDALRLYRKLGFEDVGKQILFYSWP